eukprot:8339273-Prorocentrum_lima.AAC.1
MSQGHWILSNALAWSAKRIAGWLQMASCSSPPPPPASRRRPAAQGPGSAKDGQPAGRPSAG